ncbi:hypothetical protein GCM10009772_50950 [Pseudonocardia alni subsp. carboxydivorans]
MIGSMSDQRIETSRIVDASPAEIFAVLRDPRGHVAIDSSGMLMSAEGEPVSAAGDTFVVHMDRESLGDRPMGRYDVTVHIASYVPDREISWTIVGVMRPPVGHVYGYRLEPVGEADGGGTRVVSWCDWSDIHPQYRDSGLFPVISAASLKATLGILARTVQTS